VSDDGVSINLIRSLSKLIHGVSFFTSQVVGYVVGQTMEKIEEYPRITQMDLCEGCIKQLS
jgi:hypothetical protein